MRNTQGECHPEIKKKKIEESFKAKTLESGKRKETQSGI